jgi:fructose 1,6-bisphosphate aldolase/phosphatase
MRSVYGGPGVQMSSSAVTTVQGMTTVSVFRACAGGYVGSGHVHPALLDASREAVAEAKDAGIVADGYLARCGDGIGLVLLHDATDPVSVRTLAQDVFGRAVSVATRLHQHGLNGGIDVDSVELSFVARESEPVLCFFSDRARAGAWNAHLYRMFADPFNTPSLVCESALGEGFRFVLSNDETFELPGDLYRFLGAAGNGSAVCEVRSRATGDVAAVASCGSDPVLIVRAEPPFPGVEEVLEAFTFSYATGVAAGAASPLVPVSANGDASTRSDGRAVGLGFQISPDRLVGPRDLLGDAAFDDARKQAVAAAAYLKRHGPFAPGGVSPAVARA